MGRKPLNEAGRRNSAKDRKSIMDSVRSMLNALDDDDREAIAAEVNKQLRDKRAKLIVKEGSKR